MSVRREHAWIPMADGVRLSATLYLPADPAEGPWCPILEALPYRKDDLTSSYRPEYVRLAETGYVVCRVDLRGTGSSQGIALDEYPAVERTDLITVIDWLATREWSTGNVGMYGTSYSGFNSIQIAMERPPALKAIIPIFATDDRYADDVHYFGGALKQLDSIDYPTYMIAMNALPPVPSIFGEGWRDEWDRRVRDTDPWVLTWLAHQRYDDYWKFGSLIEDYASIEAATMIVAGWADGYTNNSLRAFEAMTAPTRVLIGPWSHAAVETCLPGPNIDLVAEELRWWDRWLRGIDNGVDREPPIMVYAQRSTLPAADRREVRGSWRYEPTWPAARLEPTAFPLAKAEPGGLAPGDGPDVLRVRGDVGHTAWISCAGQMPWGQSTDQRPDELHSLTYTWDELDEELEILGTARVRVRVTSSEPVAYLAAKVTDVFPDGTSSLVVRGMLNLAHRESREAPSPLEPGVAYDVEFPLEVCSWTFERGHRIRLDLAGAEWPNAWAPPSAAELTIERSTAVLELPVMDGPSPVQEVPALLPPPPPERTSHAKKELEKDGVDDARGWIRWRVEEDVLGHERRALVGSFGDYEAEGDVPSFLERYEGEVAVSTEDPGGASAHGRAEFTMRWPEATCTAATEMRIDSDRDAYHVTIDLVVSEGEQERGRRRWERDIPRDLQ